MNMKKMRLITIATLLAVMVALTGLAAAEATIITVIDPADEATEITCEGTCEGGVTIAAGAGIFLTPNGNTHTVLVTAPGGEYSFKIKGLLYNGLGPAYNVGTKFDVAITGNPAILPAIGDLLVISVPGPIPFPSPQTFVTTYTPDVTQIGDDAYIEYSSTYMIGTSTYTMKNRVHLVVIDDTPDANTPEFPTVALPVAAVIGLVFFFQHRKRKEG
jgi:hypothetical protein